MKIITHKYGDATLTTNIHGNRLEKATFKNIKIKMVAGTGKKDGQLYVFRKSHKIKLKDADTYRCLVTDYIVEDEMTDFTKKQHNWLYRRFRRRKKGKGDIISKEGD